MHRFILTTGVSPSSPDIILAQSSSQHRFSSAVATKAAQRANALYRSDQVRSKDFMVGFNNRNEKFMIISVCAQRQNLNFILSNPIQLKNSSLSAAVLIHTCIGKRNATLRSLDSTS